MTATRDDAAAVPFRPPLEWGAMLAFLAPRATPGVEAVDGATYRRTIEVGGARGTMTVRLAPGEPALIVHTDLPGVSAELGGRVQRMFDLAADPLAIAAHLRRSPLLAAQIEAAAGLRVPGAWDPFELAVRAVLGQQVTVRGATTLAGRLVRAFGTALRGAEDGLSHLFPAAAALRDADVASIGVPRARAATIRALATAVARGGLALDVSPGLDDTVARLIAVPGIGPWTAQYVAMRALGERDAFPATDLGLRRALRGRTRYAARDWRPWRAYAALHLWTSLADKEGTA